MVGWFGRLRNRNDRGASLVEFALIMPLLVLLIFGMAEAGWVFANHLEVRHGAREGARLAAVDFSYETGDPQDQGNTADDRAREIVLETCSRMNASTAPSVGLALPDGVDRGGRAVVTVSSTHSSLTGFIPFFSDIALQSSVEIRLEQDANWNEITIDDLSIGPEDCP